MRTLLAIAVGFLLVSPALGSHLRISEVREAPSSLGGRAVALTLRWDNAWRNERNHDAAWIFVKVRSPRGLSHASIREVRFVDDAPVPGVVTIAEGGVGAFVAPASAHRGAVEWGLEIELDTASIRAPPGAAITVLVHGIEMVYVPEGAFWLGESARHSPLYGCHYLVGPEGIPSGPFHVTSEEEIRVSPEAGSLYQFEDPPTRVYTGDRGGPIPPAFPKGYRAFYCMKYEITQGQYAAFLASLAPAAQSFRSPIAHPDYRVHRGSIELEGGVPIARSPDRPMNFISWDDGCAFADWSGLRPMTEFEFEKACRGSGVPVELDYPWGSADRGRLARVMVGDDLAREGDADESHLRDDTRDVLGASHYWIMDLAGSVWERCVTASHPAGRAFQGSHGDGRLSDYGSHTNSDWPRGDDLSGGYGYRGGGFYTHDHDYSAGGGFNPYSPVAWRRFGAWGQGPRTNAYGYRCVRSAP